MKTFNEILTELTGVTETRTLQTATEGSLIGVPVQVRHLKQGRAVAYGCLPEVPRRAPQRVRPGLHELLPLFEIQPPQLRSVLCSLGHTGRELEELLTDLFAILAQAGLPI